MIHIEEHIAGKPSILIDVNDMRVVLLSPSSFLMPDIGACRPDDWRIASRSVQAIIADPGTRDIDLILLDDGVAEAVVAIRNANHVVASVPIVRIGGSPSHDGTDEVLALPLTRGALDALADRWRPLALPALDRLAVTFGAEEVRRLAAGLRDQLRAGLGTLDSGADLRGVAHRIAGFAGMLGLPALGRAWGLASEGATDGIGALRIDTRRAIHALDRACR